MCITSLLSRVRKLCGSVPAVDPSIAIREGRIPPISSDATREDEVDASIIEDEPASMEEDVQQAGEEDEDVEEPASMDVDIYVYLDIPIEQPEDATERDVDLPISARTEDGEPALDLPDFTVIIGGSQRQQDMLLDGLGYDIPYIITNYCYIINVPHDMLLNVITIHYCN